MGSQGVFGGAEQPELAATSAASEGPREVAAAAIVVDGRVLAARRTHPADVEGGWELPGGKHDGGETAAEAVGREIREELGCEIAYVRPLSGRVVIKPGYELTAHVAQLVSGEPVPHEHDAVRWLAPEELGDVDWLPADRPFLDEIGGLLADGARLPGGNVDGAVRIGRTVRRTVGPWTPGVHALLAWLAERGLDAVPRVLGADDRDREVLEFMPGQVPDVDGPEQPVELVADAMRWLRRFHVAVDGFDHPGPWRNGDGPRRPGQIFCHHDMAPYNVSTSSSATGGRVVGVYDWDLASPGTPLQDLAFCAWNWVPLWRDLPAELAAARLRVMAQAYDGEFGPAHIAAAVPERIERSIRVITEGAAAGDPGMQNLVRMGTHHQARVSLDGLRQRLPSILAAL